ncbi:hypothetical protein DTO164E3_4520 [Paecilomyces variotii]|nr:hypothetical protein DTO164E3_4520 [Paecilomyces variotii]KAJ9203353.1 hypothetical protein DTO032I3_3220 [Paecilomyces variotii]KAJ9278911.1 hypothetical protein DTO021D3_4227 [Paecilomyces variotii]KAJ9295225.1 hypothetical protein DTO217A2_9084 [Paecilomyces variotii]KAJ9323176.1 hypothetical protein DTO027B3_5747 [Paecilomyces variotii]
MASVFTYDPDPPRVSSPWSASGSSTPQLAAVGPRGVVTRSRTASSLGENEPGYLSDYGITKLEPEPQEGPTEYKLHLLLRPRRLFSSISTGRLVGGSYHSKSSFPALSHSHGISEMSPRFPQSPSDQSRQQRLQQLTTQLLWRLQQSSPFHSSSTANLVLPVLPEATPRLGVPSKPARLLPGLEESQGALYEIGVADDGTFVGLTEDELEESMSNLQAMATSLGCKVEVLRKVVVGNCEWTEDLHLESSGTPKTHSENLWVAEALVSPDIDYYRSSMPRGPSEANNGLDTALSETTDGATAQEDSSRTEQIRVSITGPSGAGKSSLLGTLTTSALDNGRGKSRLSLLKHRHEISSGVTSSVAQELIGYGPKDPESREEIEVINYASPNTTAWNDIHVAADGGRLAFVSDLPGLTRYIKSTVRGLMSWAPHYVLLCVPANCCEEKKPELSPPSLEQAPEIDICLSYLELCVKLEVPILLAITKLDKASRSGLRQTLTKVLSALKTAGKKPHMLPVPKETGKASNLQRISPLDSEEAMKTVAAADGDWSRTVPIILTSAVDGSGIGKLHALLEHLPIPRRPPSRTIQLPGDGQSYAATPDDLFDIDEVFAIPPSKVYSAAAENEQKVNRGVVLCGLMRHGTISVGDELLVGPFPVDPRTDDGVSSNVQRNQPYANSGPTGYSSPHSLPSTGRISGQLSTSYGQTLSTGRSHLHFHGEWQRVRIVSVRNLRFPVRTLLEDQVGTIGVEPVCSTPNKEPLQLERAGKGMILARIPSPQQGDASSISTSLPFHVGFIASFPASDFSSALSPPLVLGGTVKIYTCNIRATAKVTCVALADQETISAPPSPSEPGFFSFDGDDMDRDSSHTTPHGIGVGPNKASETSDASKKERINITFAFVSSIEWLEIGSQVLVMPGISAGASEPDRPTSLTGLEGFVGRISEVLGGETAHPS